MCVKERGIGNLQYIDTMWIDLTEFKREVLQSLVLYEDESGEERLTCREGSGTVQSATCLQNPL